MCDFHNETCEPVDIPEISGDQTEDEKFLNRLDQQHKLLITFLKRSFIQDKKDEPGREWSEPDVN